MKKFTVEEFQQRFDELMDRVENGESFLISSDYGEAVIIPYQEYEEIEELVRIYTDHDEGT
jgi:prevent-host-death family protein